MDDKPKESKKKNETITEIPIAAPKKTQKRLSQNEEDAQEIARAIKKAARGVKHIPIPPGVETFSPARTFRLENEISNDWQRQVQKFHPSGEGLEGMLLLSSKISFV